MSLIRSTAQCHISCAHNFLIGSPAKIYNPQKFSTSPVQWPHQLLLVQIIDSLICVIINTIFEMAIMEEPFLSLDTTTTLSFLSLLLASAAMAVRNHS